MNDVICGYITDSEWNILVVDKLKEDWRILTILPWWKPEDGETYEATLRREILEELWIESEIWNIIWDILGSSPSSWIQRKVHLFEAKIKTWGKILTNAEVENARYLSSEEILLLESTTDLTRKIVNELITKI